MHNQMESPEKNDGLNLSRPTDAEIEMWKVEEVTRPESPHAEHFHVVSPITVEQQRVAEPLHANSQNKPSTTSSNEPPRDVRLSPLEGTASTLLQVYVCTKKNLLQKVRQPVQTVVDFLIPVLFVAGLVASWAPTGMTHWPDAMFVRDGDVVFDHVTPAQMLLCTNTSDPAAWSLPFRPCNQSAPRYRCFPAGRLPVDGLCVEDWMAGVALAMNVAVNFTIPRRVPGFDEIVVLRWLARGTLWDQAPYWRDFPAPEAAMAFGSKLFFLSGSASSSLVEHLNRTTRFFRHVFGGYFATEAAAIDYVMSPSGHEQVWALLDVEDNAVVVRMNRTSIARTNVVVDRLGRGIGMQDNRLYWSSGFLTLMHEIQSFSLMRSNPGAPAIPRPALAQMPYPGFKESEFLEVSADLTPLVLVLAYLYPVVQLVKQVVVEKEERVREGMMIMGLRNIAFYLSWLPIHALQQVVSTLIITIILKASIMPSSDPTFVFFILVLFSFSTVTLATLIAAVFSKARVAAAVTPVLYLLSTIPMTVIDSEDPSTSRALPLCVAILSPSAFTMGMRHVFRYERHRGMGWHDSGNPLDRVNMNVIFAFLAADTVLYFLATLYLDAVLPSEWGSHAHPLFCLMCCCSKAQQQRNKHDSDDSDDDNELIEKDERSLADASVRVLRLRKEFDSTVAVNDVSLNLFPDEVNVLLGHNGAGKTTLINVLTGMMEATSGDAFVYGRSILSDMNLIRRDIGLCPQHSILFPNLTVREHLEFFAGLKGLNAAQRDESATAVLGEAGLGEYEDTFAQNLSGGWKRRLSVAIAFIGGSRLILLDEPTAGMDAHARRYTWEMIRRMAKGRTILLTTHFMDEADLLGHRVTIMNAGAIHCSGSPLFLKTRLGAGYTLGMALVHGCSEESIVEAIRSVVPSVSVVSQGGGELTVALPSACAAQLPELLSFLEGSADLGVRSWDISVTTMEEVFLSTSQLKTAGSRRRLSLATSPQYDFGGHKNSMGWKPAERIGSHQHWARQLGALLMKRIHGARRDVRTILFCVLLPVACVLVSMIFADVKSVSLGPLSIGPGMYATSQELLTSGCNSSFVFDPRYAVTATQLPMSTPFNFSRYMLQAHDHHSGNRHIAVQCATTSGEPYLFFNGTVSPHATAEVLTAYMFAVSRQALNGTNDATVIFTSHPLPVAGREGPALQGLDAVFDGVLRCRALPLHPDGIHRLGCARERMQSKAPAVCVWGGLHCVLGVEPSL